MQGSEECSLAGTQQEQERLRFSIYPASAAVNRKKLLVLPLVLNALGISSIYWVAGLRDTESLAS